MPENEKPISKVQAIRDYIATHPEASPKTVAEALVNQGIQATPAFVATVRHMMARRKQPVREPKTPPVARQHVPKKKSAPLGGSPEVKTLFEAIVGMTDVFCRDHLNDEYAMLCRNLATALARKRPSPLVRGQLETWAVGIIRTIGWVNFLDDSSQKPHLKLPFIDKAFGVAESTGQGKSKLIRKLLRIRQFDPRWTVPSRLDDNPMIWMVSVNGFIVNLRYAPRELQVEAYEKGLIPYIPADRNNKSQE